MVDIEVLRKKIDETDKEILKLFLSRMEVAADIARYKEKNGLPVLDEKREKEVLGSKTKNVDDKNMESYVKTFFSGLMAVSRQYQTEVLEKSKKEQCKGNKLYIRKDASSNSLYSGGNLCGRGGEVNVVYQGVTGAYSEEALDEYFGDAVKKINVKNFEDVFLKIESGEADFGVLPVENSSTGTINDVFDLLAKYNCYIVGEHYLNISHCLAAMPDTKPEEIDEIFSHEQGFFQCKEFLKNYENVMLTPYFNTALSAKKVSDLKDNKKAAIASVKAAKTYGLSVLFEKINSSNVNITRFVIISKKPIDSPKNDKISLIFVLKHQSGSLYRVLSHFFNGGLNLLKIESRPMPGKAFEYMFFVDFSGNISDESVKKTMNNISADTLEYKVLGNYVKK